MKSFLSIIAISVIALAAQGMDSAKRGVLILAHGSSMGDVDEYPEGKSQCEISHLYSDWEKSVCKVVEMAAQKVDNPIEVGFGMFKLKSFQHAVNRLSTHGITELLVIPLYVNSKSVVIRVQEYMFGTRKKNPVKWDPGHVVLPKSVGRLKYNNALDRAWDLSHILYKRTLEFTENPAQEELILVAHGPSYEEDDKIWMRDLNLHANRIQDFFAEDGLPFSKIQVLTLQDDAEDDVRNRKTQLLRQMVVKTVDSGKKSLILPVLLAKGGIESGIHKRLEGLNYKMLDKFLAPDEDLSHWILKQIKKP